MEEKKRRYLKKMGSDRLMLFGYTKALAARKDMIECDANGVVIVSEKDAMENSQACNVSPKNAFNLGMSFMKAGEKTLKTWLNENIVAVNSAGIEIQGLVIEKWQKHFPGEPMPDTCLFINSGNLGEE